MERTIAPSMLSADFGHLERDTQMIDRSAARWIHIDVMDGVFVPNISFGFPVLKAIRRASKKFLDVHLMIVEPEKYVARFAEAGANLVTFHYEASAEPHATVELIRAAGAKVGVSIKPATPVEVLRELLPEVDLVLVMSVEPGFGGQSFIPSSLEKIAQLRTMVREAGFGTIIEVDGGISSRNAAESSRRVPTCWWPAMPSSALRTPRRRLSACSKPGRAGAARSRTRLRKAVVGPSGEVRRPVAGCRVVGGRRAGGAGAVYAAGEPICRIKSLPLPPIFEKP